MECLTVYVIFSHPFFPIWLLWRPGEMWVITIPPLQMRQKLRHSKRWDWPKITWPENGRGRPYPTSWPPLALRSSLSSLLTQAQLLSPSFFIAILMKKRCPGRVSGLAQSPGWSPRVSPDKGHILSITSTYDLSPLTGCQLLESWGFTLAISVSLGLRTASSGRCMCGVCF